MKILIILLSLIVATTTKVIDPPLEYKCDPSWKFFVNTGYCYRVGYGLTKGQTEAKSLCAAENSHLASIRSEAENAVILEYLSELNYVETVWIGVYRTTTNGTDWKYEPEGTPVEYTNWGLNQPDNYGISNCVNMYVAGVWKGLWNDIQCDHSRVTNYVCKKAPNF